MKCSTCRHMHEPGNEWRTYQCRRNPPQIVSLPGEDDPSWRVGVWPEIEPKHDWCGEYLPRHLTDEEAGNA